MSKRMSLTRIKAIMDDLKMHHQETDIARYESMLLYNIAEYILKTSAETKDEEKEIIFRCEYNTANHLLDIDHYTRCNNNASYNLSCDTESIHFNKHVCPQHLACSLVDMTKNGKEVVVTNISRK